MEKVTDSKAGNYNDRNTVDLPENLVPQKSWVKMQVKKFAELRIGLERHRARQQQEGNKDKKKVLVPHKNNDKGITKIQLRNSFIIISHFIVAGWCIFLYGASFWNKVLAARLAQYSSNDEEEDDDEKPVEITEENKAGHEPLTSLVCQLGPSVCAALFEFHVEWVEDLEGLDLEAEHIGTWIYSLMARLEKPLHPDVISSLRTLVIACSKQRSKIIPEPEKNTKLINILTMFICIGAKYFGQEDLEDKSG